MSGLMETLAALHLPQNPPPAIEAIVPTIVLPFALLGAILSSLATAVAAWFGIAFKADGSKRLLEVLLRPKVIVVAVVLNAVVIGGYKGFYWAKESSRPLMMVKLLNGGYGRSSEKIYPNTDSPEGAPFSTKAANGLKLQWETQIPDGAFRGLTLSGTSAFAGGMDGFVYELETSTGKVLRRFYVGQPVTPRPVVHEGRLFVGEGEHLTHHARVYVFDLKTGDLIGAVQTKGHTEGDLVFADVDGKSVLFVPAGSDGLYAVDPVSLKTLWHANLPHFDSGVTVVGNSIFFTTGVEKGMAETTPRLYALDVKSGKTKWQVDLAASGWSRPVVQGEAVCVGLGEIYSERRYGQLACYELASGRAVTAMNFEAPLFNTPLVVDNEIVVSSTDGQVCRVDAIQGIRKWCSKLNDKKGFYAWPVPVAHNLVVAPEAEGYVTLDLTTGERVAEWKPGKNQKPWTLHFGAISVGEDGLYAIDAKGVVRKLSIN